MSSASPTPVIPAAPVIAPGPTPRQLINKDIMARWTKLAEADVAGVKTKDELVKHVFEKCGQDIVLKEVDALLRGRSL